MKYLILILISGCSTLTPYTKTGIKYNLHESQIEWKKGVNTSEAYKYSCLLELGIKNGSGVTVSLMHESKCFIGAPFNNKDEYSSDGLFIGYERSF